MKRSASAEDVREMESPNKRQRNGDRFTDLRILIPSRVAGYIIGKGGSNISRLRAENKASISVPSCPGPERLVRISAEDEEVVFHVLSLIIPLIKEGSADRAQPVLDYKTVEVRLLYHHTLIGSIIGKGGAGIKELRETTNTKIKVYGTRCPRSADRVVGIIGSAEMVLDVIKRITLILWENPMKYTPDGDFYDPHNYDETSCFTYGGFVEGIRRGQGRDGSGDRPSSSIAPHGEWRGGGSRDDPRHVHNPGPLANYEPPKYVTAEVSSTQVTIPNALAGSIIGKGGTRIRWIRSESRASVEISAQLPGSSDRIITIIGRDSEIRLAQQLMQQSVIDNAGRGSWHGV